MNIDLRAILSRCKTCTTEEIESAGKRMVDDLIDWFSEKYPSARLEIIERNLAEITEIRKYDDACKVCMSTQMCPTKDGNRMNGKLLPTGWVKVWYEPCPKGYKPPKTQPVEQTTPKKDWRSMA